MICGRRSMGRYLMAEQRNDYQTWSVRNDLGTSDNSRGWILYSQIGNWESQWNRAWKRAFEMRSRERFWYRICALHLLSFISAKSLSISRLSLFQASIWISHRLAPWVQKRLVSPWFSDPASRWDTMVRILHGFAPCQPQNWLSSQWINLETKFVLWYHSTTAFESSVPHIYYVPGDRLILVIGKQSTLAGSSKMI